MENKVKIAIIIFVLFLLVCGSVANSENINYTSNEDQIPSEIIEMGDKILTKDINIGDICVRYWEHLIDDIYVKNDYILLHNEIENGEILDYDISWTDIEITNIDDTDFEPNEYFWKKKVLFSEPEDRSFFYEFYQSQEYPVICWEVRHTDGTTILYDIDGKIIGDGVPAPYNGFSMSGFHESSYPDPWLDWRLNANSWYTNWCDSTGSISFQTPDTISSYISDPVYELFYEIAHGGSNSFKATQSEYYYASDVTTALQDRNPMRFAFIGSCGGMDNTGPGTWSYEFRKGDNLETVAIGYTGMGSCPGWSVSLQWQDYMFYVMDQDKTIKNAFDLACAEYPTIAPCVVFTGDTNLEIREEEEQREKIILPKVMITYPSTGDIVNDTIPITGNSHHLEGKVKMVMLKIGDRDWVEADGTSEWSYECDTTTIPDGEILIQAVSIDTRGVQSAVRYARAIVKNKPDDPEAPKIPDLNCEGVLNWGKIDPEVIVSGGFTVENIGDDESLLNWSIVEYPDWGEWSFSPDHGMALTPEKGKTSVSVELTVPDKHGEEYSGEIKIVNQNNHSDFEIIKVSLSTTTSKTASTAPLSNMIKQVMQRLFIHFPFLKFLLKL